MFCCVQFAVSGISSVLVGLRIPFCLYVGKDIISHCIPVPAIGGSRETLHKLYSKTCDKTKRLGSLGLAPLESQPLYGSFIPRIMRAFCNYAAELSL